MSENRAFADSGIGRALSDEPPALDRAARIWKQRLREAVMPIDAQDLQAAFDRTVNVWAQPQYSLPRPMDGPIELGVVPMVYQRMERGQNAAG